MAQQNPRDKLDELHDRLAHEVAALRTGEDWQRWLKVAARLHDYSFQNTLLILSQRPDATTVAGFHAWKALGRHVSRGEKGIAVLAPIVRRAPAARPTPQPPRPPPPPPARTPEQPEETKPRSAVTGFRLTYVWDITQTSGPPLPTPPEPKQLRGQAPPGLWEALADLTQAAGYTLHRRDCGGANGQTDFTARTIAVRPDVDDAQAVKTLAHELGHVRLHCPDGRRELAGNLACTGLIEVEAESVAYLVASSHGMDTSAYTFPYVTGWASDIGGYQPEDVVRITAERVLSASRWILARTETIVTHPQPAQASTQVQAQVQEGEATRPPSLARPSARARAQAAPPPPPDGERLPAVPRERLLAVHAEAATFFRRHVERSWIPAYLRGRRLEAALGAPWDAGRAPAGWTTLVTHLRRQGVDDETLLASGLAVRARTGNLIDTFRERLVLPLRDGDGQIIGFVGRAHPDASRRTPKYLNSPATVLYSKGEHVFGLAESRELLGAGAVPVLVEGPLDAIAVTTAMNGRGAGLALCGTALTTAQAVQIDTLITTADQRVGTARRPLVLGFDNDPAGRRATEDAAALFAPRGRELLAVRWPECRDPASVLHHLGPEALVAEVRERALPLKAHVVDRRLDRQPRSPNPAEKRPDPSRSAPPMIKPVPRLRNPKPPDHRLGR